VIDSLEKGTPGSRAGNQDELTILKGGLRVRPGGEVKVEKNGTDKKGTELIL